MTLAFTDIDEQASHLPQCATNTGDQRTGPKVKTLMITDPDGNRIAFAPAIDPNLAQ